MNFPFRVHGKYSIRVDEQIILSDVTGPWNRELVEEWGKQVYPFAKELAAKGPNAGIAIMHESMLCPPDALASLRLLVQYSATKLQCVAQVIVAPPGIAGRDLLEATFARVYEGLVAHRMFESLDEALVWTRQRVAEAAERSGT